MQAKTQKRYTDYSLGFPVVLINVPMIKVRGEWAPNINYNRYQEAVLELLAHKPVKLTGSEVQFIRKHFNMTVRDFAERFSIKHPAVIKWEKTKDRVTKMSWTTEKDIRLFILDQLKKRASEFYKLYRELQEEAGIPQKPIKVDAEEFVA